MTGSTMYPTVNMNTMMAYRGCLCLRHLNVWKAMVIVISGIRKNMINVIMIQNGMKCLALILDHDVLSVELDLENLACLLIRWFLSLIMCV